ncbi:Clp protease N-terminal domain-containing protein, partial [Bacillus altitudinis]|uniref:Clp protease N-terminal domain-containing protein n=1 Tax=Bacillus altitudinis TaxID=293387 RepID=UPI0023572278
VGDWYVGREDIVLGVIGEGEGVGGGVLNKVGVRLNKAREEVLEVVGRNERGGSGGGCNSNANRPTLDSVARELRGIGKEERLEAVIGGRKEMQGVIEVLSRRTKNNH